MYAIMHSTWKWTRNASTNVKVNRHLILLDSYEYVSKKQFSCKLGFALLLQGYFSCKQYRNLLCCVVLWKSSCFAWNKVPDFYLAGLPWPWKLTFELWSRGEVIVTKMMAVVLLMSGSTRALWASLCLLSFLLPFFLTGI